MKTEIVDMGAGYYAVRRTRRRFLVFTIVDYLHLTISRPQWKRRNDDYFENCITKQWEKAADQMAKYGCGEGTPVLSGIITQSEFVEIAKAAATNETIADQMKQLKEVWILAK